MMTDDSAQLLGRFNLDRSETAFRALVRLHSPAVYGAALRRLHGDQAAAQDVVQEVFTLLARKAPSLYGVQLSGWLYRQTCRRAANLVRTESRRRNRERIAVTAMAPGHEDSNGHEEISHLVDDAMLALPGPDRDALVLRYFDSRDLRSVGLSLGIGEDAARKRVNRALEKLALSLKRRGIAIGSVSLGTAMNSFGRESLAPALVSQVSARTMQSLATGSGGGIVSILKPFVCGVILTSLLASAILISLWNRKFAPGERSVNEGNSRDASRRDPSSAMLDLISRIKRTKAGPDHAMTTLRLHALLETIAIEDIPGFIAEANKRLTPAEQEACYLPILMRWLKSDPHAAAAFALKFNREFSPPGFDSGNMVRHLLHHWEDRDLRAFRGWLNDTWKHPSLGTSTFSGNLRIYFAISISDILLRDHSAAEAFAYLKTIPDQKVVTACLKAMTGDSMHASAYMNIGPDRTLELYREFSRLPDTVLASQLKVKIWQEIVENNPGHMEAMLANMTARERFEATLHRIGKYSKQVSRVKTPGGEMLGYETVDNRAQGEVDAIKAGQEAGLSRGEILQQIAIAVVMKEKPSAALEWLDLHQGEFDADPVILSRIASMKDDNFPRPVVTPSTGALLEWAPRLSDPGQRLMISRAGFRILLAGSPQAAAKFLEKPDLPEDLKAEFLNIMSPPAP